MSTPPAPPDLAQRLALIIGALQKMIAAHAGRNRGAAPMVLLIWPYLGRLARRFDALARRIHAGRPARTPPRPSAPTPARPGPTPVAPRVRAPGLPTGFAWLIRLAPDTAQLGGQVRHLLADPEFSALLAAAPQAGRILRPLCRMLGILPDPDLPPALFRPLARRTPLLETSQPPSPAPEPPIRPKPSPRRRTLPRRYLFGPA